MDDLTLNSLLQPLNHASVSLSELLAILESLTPEKRHQVVSLLIGAKEYPENLRSSAMDLAVQANYQELINPLIQLSNSDASEYIREVAFRAVVRLSGESAVAFLEHRIRHASNTQDRLLATKAAMLMPLPVAIQFLVRETLSHSDETIRYVGALYLAYYGDRSGELILKSSIESLPSGIALPPEMVRAASICALAVFGDLQARKTLHLALNNANEKPFGVTPVYLKQILRKFSAIPVCSDDELINMFF